MQAGGQLGALALMLQLQQTATGQPQLGASPVWDPTRIRGFVGVRWAAGRRLGCLCSRRRLLPLQGPR